MKKELKAGKLINTHGFIQAVQRNKGITQSIKTVLVHCLTKYQARDVDGNYYTFSIGRIQVDTGLGSATVKRAVAELNKRKVLKACGQRRFNANQYKPTTLYLFVFDALKTYLEVKSKVETTLIVNDTNGENTIDTTKNNGEKSIVKLIVKPTVIHIEEDTTKKIVKEEEDNHDYTGKSVSPNPNPFDELETCFNSVVKVSTPSASVGNISTPSASVLSDKVSTTVPPSASPAKVSMAASVVKYNPPKSFDPATHDAYDKGLLRNPPSILQFKRSLYARDQEIRDIQALLYASKKFPQSTIELID
jgi:hypothetical protein